MIEVDERMHDENIHKLKNLVMRASNLLDDLEKSRIVINELRGDLLSTISNLYQEIKH